MKALKSPDKLLARLSQKKVSILRSALLPLLVLTDTTLYSALSILRHRHFETGWDLAVFDQAIWLYSRLDSPQVTVRFNRPENVLGDHFHPIVATLSPLCWVINGAEAILIGQAFLVALSVVPVFLFTARRLGRGNAWLFALSYSLFWGMQETVRFEFHEIAFAIPLIAFAIYFIDLRKPAGYFACFLLMMLTKESMPALVAFFGIYLLLLRRYVDGLVSLTLGALTFPLMTKVVIPFFSGRFYDYWTYDALGPDLTSALKTLLRRPWVALQLLVSPVTKLRTIWLIFSPFLCLSLFSPLMILFVPIFAERFLSSRIIFWGPLYHYNATVTPIVAMAAADGLWRITKLVRRESVRKLCAGLPVAGILVINLYMLPGLPLWELTSPAYWRLTARDLDGRAALAMIPPGVSVAAQIPIAPHLTHRRGIYIIHPTITPPTVTTYIIASSQLTSHPFDSYAPIEEFLAKQQEKGYVKVFDRNGWVVLKRPGVEPGTPPVLMTEDGTTRAVALDSVRLTGAPLYLTAQHPFSQDGRTRLLLFAMNVASEFADMRAGVEVFAEDEKGNVYPVEVESVVPLDSPVGMTQLNIKLSERLSQSGHVLISIKAGGLSSNKARLDLQAP